MGLLEDYEIKEIVDLKIVPITEETEENKPSWKKWFTIEPIYKDVTKSEFESFIKAYPRKLDFDVYRVWDPPSLTYNDFELANRWPYGIVASTFGYDDDPKGYFYEPPEKRIYRILENYEELFANRTGYKE